LGRAGWQPGDGPLDPLVAVAAIGDPMQPLVAGMAMAASCHKPVMLAGGTQMLAVYSLMRTLGETEAVPWRPDRVVVGTTRWVAEDPSGDTVGLARLTQACLMATQLSFRDSRFAALRAYEQGFVKEGVGAGAAAIAAHFYRNWGPLELRLAVERVLTEKARCQGCSLT